MKDVSINNDCEHRAKRIHALDVMELSPANALGSFVPWTCRAVYSDLFFVSTMCRVSRNQISSSSTWLWDEHSDCSRRRKYEASQKHTHALSQCYHIAQGMPHIDFHPRGQLLFPRCYWYFRWLKSVESGSSTLTHGMSIDSEKLTDPSSSIPHQIVHKPRPTIKGTHLCQG